jgi:hypothetical protein
MSRKRSFSPSVQDEILLTLKEPVPLPEAKDLSDFNRDPEAYPELSEAFVTALLEMSNNKGCVLKLLKLSMLARAVKAYINEGTAPDGNIVIISFKSFTEIPNYILLFDFENNK